MGYSTELLGWVSFNRKTYISLSQVTSGIRDAEEIIEQASSKLKMLACMTEPEKFFNKNEYESAEHYIDETVKRCVEAIMDAQDELSKLYILERNWSKCHDEDGRAICPPLKMMDEAYIWGDYICETTDKLNNNNNE